MLVYIWKECDTEMRCEYTFDTYPRDVKLKCLEYVKDYLKGQDDPEIVPMPWNCKLALGDILATIQWIDKKYHRSSNAGLKNWISSVDAIYLQKWKLNKKCILFRISNKVFQANFLDGSQIFVCSSSPIACFKSAKGEIFVKNSKH